MGKFKRAHNLVILLLLAVESLGVSEEDESGVNKSLDPNAKDARGYHHIHRHSKKTMTNEITGRRDNDNNESNLCYPELNPGANVAIIDHNDRLYEGKNNEVCQSLVKKTSHFHVEQDIGTVNWLQKAMKLLCSTKYEPGVLVTVRDTITHREITGRNSIICKYKDNEDEEDQIKISRKGYSYSRKYVTPDSKEHMFFLRRHKFPHFRKGREDQPKPPTNCAEDKKIQKSSRRLVRRARRYPNYFY